MNLALAFAQSAQRDPNKTALFWGEAQFSYRQFRAQTLGVAARLGTQFGVKPGDRVGIWLKNCPEFVPAIFGVWQAGAVVVPINNFLKPPEVQFILADAGIDIVILDESMTAGFEILAAQRQGLQSFPVESFGGGDDGSGEPCESAPDALAVILYTSGTTGHPKGAMLSHANLLANVQSCTEELLAVGEDRFVVLLPMFHSFMLTVGVLLPMLIGGSIVLIKTLHPPKSIIMEIVQHRATLLPAVPQFFRALANCPLPADLPLRLCISGGAPLPAEILKQFMARFPIPLLEGYGLSEASPVVSFTPIRGPWKAGSIGVPISNVTVTIQNDQGDILPPGQIGELCVRGANVMQGYWNLPEETADTLRNGWLLTGDIGYVDPDGYFYITDRKKDMLLVNGINVYPREVEEVLYQFPGVKEAAVIGIPDARRGEQPLAFVAAEIDIQLDDKALHNFIRERLADYKVPRKIVFLPALPRNATGKVLKTELRKLI
ncbi:MAG TPA: long-chain fatty acid--CoA ligase [Candidatus Baltobacteraceae bacterium]|jgi:long-chain acyl-CoA synthetase|nr:long-chain fatty acid--CoA ligase [Candidatus Baltobacteraceae bacterium]